MSRNIIIALVFITIFSLYSCTSPSGSIKSQQDLIEKIIDSMVQPHIDSMNIAGLAIGVARNDTILLLKSYGYADLEFDVALPVSASFEIGSVTKQFTSVAILQLVDKGLICLEDDLNEYVEFDTKGRKITIEKLMNHTSGIKGYTELSSFRDFSVHDYPRDTLLRIVEQEEFDFEPGEAMIYNNTAYFMLGLIIEKVTGQTYEEYLQENIFSKAGMDNSYYCDERKIMKKKAYGYDTGKGGKLVKAAYLDHKWPYSAGSLCSTAEDLLKWNHILHESETILNKEMYELLITPSRLQDGTTIRYAKGLFVDKYKGINVISHGGGINGFLSDSRYFPDQGLAIVTLINSTGMVGPTSFSSAVADQLLPIKDNKYDNVFMGELSGFPGKYKGRGRGNEIQIEVDTVEQMLVIDLFGERDTLNYTGNNRWALRNQFFSFVELEGEIKQLHVDMGYGYYILNKVE